MADYSSSCDGVLFYMVNNLDEFPYILLLNETIESQSYTDETLILSHTFKKYLDPDGYY